jgi:hypothetical protein
VSSGPEATTWRRESVLYLGHYTFVGEQPDDSASAGEMLHGWFTALCEASSADEAKDKFGGLIEALEGEGFTLFDSVRNVYLEDITEVESLPEAGVLARWQEYDGSIPFGTISTNLPGPTEGVESYTWERDLADDEEYEVEPFYVFERDGA